MSYARHLAFPPLLALFFTAILFQNNAFALELTLQDTWCGVNSATRMACDTVNHLLYVTSPTEHEIVVFSENGEVVDRIATAESPGAIALSNDGNLIVSTDRSVRKISMDGLILLTYGLIEDYFSDPHDVLCLPDGRVYVADDDDVIKVFDNTGAPLFTFGSYGYFNGRFDEPVAIAYNPVTEEILVNDQNNYRFQAFDAAGALLYHWGSEGNGLYTDGAFFRAFGIDVDGLGRIWSLDVLTDLVQVFDADGEFVFSASLNSPEIRGGVDIAIDGDVLYVSSPSTNCVFVYGITNGTTPTNEPLELTIMWIEDGAQLNWKAQTGVVGYRVERSSDLEFAEAAIEIIATVTDTTFTDNLTANPHDQCYYRVIAMTDADDPGFALERLGDGRYHDPLDTEHDSPHHVTHGVNCNSCHLRPYIYPRPRAEWWYGDHLCKSCHVETGFAKAVETHLGADSVRCGVCHSAHYHQPQFERYFIRNENPMGNSNPMAFNHATDFVHGAPNYDGICEICHTQTDYYRANGKGLEHNTGSNCISCHTHENGFMPTTGDREE